MIASLPIASQDRDVERWIAPFFPEIDWSVAARCCDEGISYDINGPFLVVTPVLKNNILHGLYQEYEYTDSTGWQFCETRLYTNDTFYGFYFGKFGDLGIINDRELLIVYMDIKLGEDGTRQGYELIFNCNGRLCSEGIVQLKWCNKEDEGGPEVTRNNDVIDYADKTDGEVKTDSLSANWRARQYYTGGSRDGLYELSQNINGLWRQALWCNFRDGSLADFHLSFSHSIDGFHRFYLNIKPSDNYSDDYPLQGYAYIFTSQGKLVAEGEILIHKTWDPLIEHTDESGIKRVGQWKIYDADTPGFEAKDY